MNRFKIAAARRWLAVTAVLLLSALAAPAMAQSCTGFANSLAVDPAAQNAQEFDAGNNYGPVTVTLTIKNATSLPAGATLVWTQTSGPAVTLNTFNPLRPTFVAPVVGPAGATLGFSVQARCSGVATGSPATASVTILNVDRPPVVTALASPPIANASQLVTLTATASDPDGDAIAYTWTQTAGTPAVTLSAPGAASTAFVAPTVPAEVTLQFQVEARSGTLARTATVNVTVTAANLPPFAELKCPSVVVDGEELFVVDEGELFRLDGTGSYDPEGAALTYEWFIDEMEVGLVFSLDGESGNYVDRIAPNLGLGMTGGVEVRLRVRESATVFSDATCAFMVADATAPVISGGGDRTVDATSPAGANVAYGLSATDNVEGDVSEDLVCIPPSGSPFALDVPTDVDCEVSDLNDNRATAEFVVTVRDLTSPVIDPHDAVAVEATGPLTAVTYDPPGTFDVVDVDLVATCAPPSGADFTVGSHTITCDAEDAAGNDAVPTTFMLTVHDYTPPAITVPAPITAEATSSLGASVIFSVSASDIADPDVPVLCSPASGSTFALGGPHTVNCSATDDSSNTAHASFGITVRDTTAPLLASGTDQLLEATSPAGAVATYVLLASDTVDPDVPVLCSPASGSTFALGGPHTVNCSATDDSSNTTQTSFDITVQDTTAPVISGAADQTLEATSAAGAAANFAPTAADIADPAVAVLCSANSGDTFPLGNTIVNCTATDDSGNQSAASFTITVQDTTAPVIASHVDLVAEATGPAGASVGYTSPATSDAVDGAGTASCTAASGSTFAIGTTTVTCTASDNAGNAATPTSFTVTVRDTTAPTLSGVSGNLAVYATSASGATVSWLAPTATDIVDGIRTVSCTSAPTPALTSGSTFPPGATTMTCSASDTRGNTATQSFTVTVSYAWTGFFQPVDNTRLNRTKAGSAVPVKFSLGGDMGLAIFTSGYPRSVVMACDTSALVDDVEATVNAGGSSLSYDATSGQYVYVWKTDKAWGGTCRQLQLKLADGSVRTANFQFTR